MTEKKYRTKFTLSKLNKMAFHVWRQFDDPHYAGIAAQIAYFFFMASIPAIVVVTEVLGLFDVSLDFIEEWLNSHLSSHMNSFLSGLMHASSNVGTNILLIVLAIWAASSLEFSLSRVTTYTISRGRYKFRFFEERLFALPVALMSLIAVSFALVIYVYGEGIALRIIRNEYIAGVIGALKTPVLAVLFFVVIFANYCILPRIRVPAKAILPGAIVATTGIVLVTFIYSKYIGYSATYDVLYGSFANIVALMLWFFFLSWVLVIGMMFNMSWDKYMERGLLTEEAVRGYLEEKYKSRPEEFRRHYYQDSDYYDRSLDTPAVKMSRLLVKGYAGERNREISKMKRINEEKMLIQMELDRKKNSLQDTDAFSGSDAEYNAKEAE